MMLKMSCAHEGLGLRIMSEMTSRKANLVGELVEREGDRRRLRCGWLHGRAPWGARRRAVEWLSSSESDLSTLRSRLHALAGCAPASHTHPLVVLAERDATLGSIS